MTAKEFIIRIEKFYEPFAKPEIKLEFFNVIHKFRDSQIDLIFDMYIQHIPSTYSLDMKSLYTAIQKSGLTIPKKKRFCPACRKELVSNSVICEHCCFDTSGTENPQEYYQWVQTDSIQNAAQRAEQVRRIIAGFVQNKQLAQKDG